MGHYFQASQTNFFSMSRIERIGFKLSPKHKKLSAQSIEFICKNVPSFLEKFNLSGQAVENEHFEMLLERCKNLTELCLCNTHITRDFWTTLPDKITKVVKCQVQRYGGYGG
jgi:hypothetical protein